MPRAGVAPAGAAQVGVEDAEPVAEVGGEDAEAAAEVAAGEPGAEVAAEVVARGSAGDATPATIGITDESGRLVQRR
jgi:hypothetical protein